MKKRYLVLAAAAATALAAGGIVMLAQPQQDGPPQAPMTFFVTSTNNTGNLGGLAGADALCLRLAQAAGSPENRTWHAYLSTQATDDQPAVNARDRIGTGPWHNANGVMIASNVANLHGDIERDRNYLFGETAIDEEGETIPGRIRPEGVQNSHDIMTGSNSLGYALPPGEDRTCRNWTYDGEDGSVMLGHHDRSGGNDTSWNMAHASRGCTNPLLNSTGGNGKIYCFAID